MNARAAALLLFVCSPASASAPQADRGTSVELALSPDETESSEIERLMSRGSAESRKGRWFWACEAWLELLREKPGLQSPRARLADAFRLAQAKLAAGDVAPSEKLYFSALASYLVQDNASLWTRWQDLEKIPRYAEEARWFLWGPQAAFYREAWGDRRWERSAELFRRGWEKSLASDWRAAAPLFREAVAARSDHFLAAIYLDDSRREVARLPAAPRSAPVARWFPGTAAERLEAGRGAFLEGRWSLALALFASAAAAGSPVEIRARARRAAARLDWMFNYQQVAAKTGE